MTTQTNIARIETLASNLQKTNAEAKALYNNFSTQLYTFRRMSQECQKDTAVRATALINAVNSLSK